MHLLLFCSSKALAPCALRLRRPFRDVRSGGLLQLCFLAVVVFRGLPEKRMELD